MKASSGKPPATGSRCFKSHDRRDKAERADFRGRRTRRRIVGDPANDDLSDYTLFGLLDLPWTDERLREIESGKAKPDEGEGRGSRQTMEGDLDPAYVSALAALAGALIGGLTSFATSWLTQRAQLRHAHREAERGELRVLDDDFITEASRLYMEALTSKTDDIDDITGLVGLYATVGRMSLVSDQAVIDAARRVERTIVETYLGPNRTVRELMDHARQGKMNLLVEFSAACRKDLDARTTTIR